ncbi:MAG: hypothetical protein II117_02600 [Clostridia bacterium]|nr:hypothetical protein [Clostridia bacterium]
MKKWIAMILGALLLISAAACAQKTDGQNTAETPAPEQNADAELTGTEETNEEPPVGTLAGGWQVAENNEMTEERKAVFEKGLEGLVGVDYVPIAYLGSQVVAGTNHCILAEGKVVYPNSTPMYVLVFLYEDLSGNVSLMNIENLPIIAEDDGTLSAPGGEMLMGGWAYADSYEVTDEMRDRLNKALEETVGASYEPIANLGTQVVAGLNRCLLCKVTPVVLNPEANYALVYVYEDLSGGAALNYVIDFDFGAYCTYGA